MTIPRHLLPPSLAKIADYLGDELMWMLWEHYGGGHVVIPKHLPPDHHLCNALGHAQALRVCAIYGGELLRIPRANDARLAVRNACIKQEWKAGYTQHELARKFALTERQIGYICAQREPVPAPVNTDLFSSPADTLSASQPLPSGDWNHCR